MYFRGNLSLVTSAATTTRILERLLNQRPALTLHANQVESGTLRLDDNGQNWQM